jgi:hypothetical protein
VLVQTRRWNFSYPAVDVDRARSTIIGTSADIDKALGSLKTYRSPMSER